MGARAMKFMGSKRVMLKNGLGELLSSESRYCKRIVDLFCGAASVSWFAAININKPVLAIDLQQFAVILASSVIGRTSAFSSINLEKEWLELTVQQRQLFPEWNEAIILDNQKFNTAIWQSHAQKLCSTNKNPASNLIWNSYGGHYFSPSQALTFDAMLSTLPQNQEKRQERKRKTIFHSASS